MEGEDGVLGGKSVVRYRSDVGSEGGGSALDWGAHELMHRVSGALKSEDWYMAVVAAGECQKWLKCLLGRFSRKQNKAGQRYQPNSREE